MILACSIDKNTMENTIIDFIKENYNTDIKIVEIKKALHLSGKKYQYKAYLSDDPLSIFQGYFDEETNKVSAPNIDFILFQSHVAKDIKEVCHFDSNTVLKFFCEVRNNPSDTVDYAGNTIDQLYAKYKHDLFLIVYIYQFTPNESEEFDPESVKVFFDFLARYQESSFALAYHIYPEGLLKSNLFENGFCFRQGYVAGAGTCFEARNYNLRKKSFEVYDVSYNDLLAKWKNKHAR